MIIWQPGMSLEFLERLAIFEAMKFFQNNKSATARALGIAPRTLDNKLEKYAADDKEREKFDQQQRANRESLLQRQRNGALADSGGNSSQAGSNQNGQEARKETPGNGAQSGMDAQPAAKISPQQSVPLSQRKEVQSVLPKDAAKIGNHGRR
jgi:hypothetical protein